MDNSVILPKGRFPINEKPPPIERKLHIELYEHVWSMLKNLKIGDRITSKQIYEAIRDVDLKNYANLSMIGKLVAWSQRAMNKRTGKTRFWVLNKKLRIEQKRL